LAQGEGLLQNPGEQGGNNKYSECRRLRLMDAVQLPTANVVEEYDIANFAA